MDADEDHAMDVTGSETEDRLVSEFQSWRDENRNHVPLCLDKIEKDTDGTASLRLHLRFVWLSCSDVISVLSKIFLVRIESENFTLRCPPSYPDYDTTQDNFFVEAPSCLQLWGNALNEFLLDSQDQLSLVSILSKGCSLYSSKDRTEMMDYEDTSEQDEDDYGEEEEEEEEEIGPEDYHLDDMLDKDLTWELEVRIAIIQVRLPNQLVPAGRQEEEEVETEGGPAEDGEGPEGGGQQ